MSLQRGEGGGGWERWEKWGLSVWKVMCPNGKHKQKIITWWDVRRAPDVRRSRAVHMENRSVLYENPCLELSSLYFTFILLIWSRAETVEQKPQAYIYIIIHINISLLTFKKVPPSVSVSFSFQLNWAIKKLLLFGLRKFNATFDPFTSSWMKFRIHGAGAQNKVGFCVLPEKLTFWRWIFTQG